MTYQVSLSAAGVDAYTSVCGQASTQQVGDTLLTRPGDAACQVATVAAEVSVHARSSAAAVRAPAWQAEPTQARSSVLHACKLSEQKEFRLCCRLLAQW